MGIETRNAMGYKTYATLGYKNRTYEPRETFLCAHWRQNLG
jgi:hypothetical protein